MQERYNEDETLIYICVDGSCQLPQVEVKDALKQLKIKF